MLTSQWLMAVACLLATGGQPFNPPWLSDYDKALALARAERKPLFVVFRCEH